MATTQYIENRVPHSVKPPSSRVSLGYKRSLIPTNFFLGLSEHAVIGFFIFNEFIYVFVEDCVLEALSEAVE
jgi:hypothetical protein